jgi:F-type H+-transporting ATPase subunit delta
MIKEEIITKRYADAFLAFARETIGLEKGLEELQAAKRVIRDNPELEDFIESREFAATEKHEAIDAIFKDVVSDETRTFLKLLIDKRRIYLLADIAEYARIHYAHGGEMDALLKTSYGIDTDLIGRLKQALESNLNAKLHMYVEIDPSLLGGIYAKIGNIIIDGSVKRRLDDLREKLNVLKVA